MKKITKKKIEVEDLDYGTVIITGGKHKGKIGYFDDESYKENQAVVYLGKIFGEMTFINKKYLKNTTINYDFTTLLLNKLNLNLILI